MAFACVTPGASAQQQCDARAFGVLIDQTAQSLRTLNRESERRFHERLEALGKQKSWNDSQKADKAAAAMDDSKLEAFNNDIEELVAKLDTLSATPASEMSCARLSELKTVQEKLIAVMGQKSGFILAQLEAEGSQAPVSPYPQLPPQRQDTQASPNPQQRTQTQPGAPAKQDGAWSTNLAQAPLPRPAPAARPAPQPATASQKPSAPAADTRVASLPPPQSDAVPPQAVPAGYTAEEIREAGKGVFGSITSEFAIVMNRAFAKYGQPNAYIIGDEGGGAFLAGLRYGDGKLFTRVGGSESGPTKIYWQGPSLGADLGATGSHTLFLVYNLQDPATLYKRFPGIDGSAYVAGGFGMTVYQSGDTLIVPIRTGLGLRLGASIAYLKFTERASWNPF
jgi:hypothetical protein